MSRAVSLIAHYQQAKAALGEVAGMLTGLAVPDSGAGLWLAELTPVARLLVTGPDAASSLNAAGLPTPALFEVAIGAEACVAQTAPRQFLLSAHVTTPTTLPALTSSTGALVLVTEYAEFAVGGPDWAALILEIATADSAAPGASAWFPTQICGIDAVLCREAWGFRVLCAPAEGVWLGGALLERVRARGGCLTGFNDFLAITETTR